MISAKYYATNEGDVIITSEKKDIFGNSVDSTTLQQDIPTKNYINFFDKGIDLYDDTKVFGTINDYYGFVVDVAPNNYFELELVSTTSQPELGNGITVIFDKISCHSIWAFAVNSMGDKRSIGAVESDSGESLPLITHIPINDSLQSDENIVLQFANAEKKGVIAIKEIVFGKKAEIDTFLDFNSIFEVAPLGDDLPMNELNADVYAADTFAEYPGQEILYYDNTDTYPLRLYEKSVVVSLESTYSDRYNIKSRNQLQLGDENSYIYALAGDDINVANHWGLQSITAKTVVDDIAYGLGLEGKITYPEWFSSFKLSPFLAPCTSRQALQQIAWACTCGIITNGNDGIAFVPLLHPDTTPTTITFYNEGGRILETTFTQNEKYSTILWEYNTYYKDSELSDLGKVTVEQIGTSDEYLFSIYYDEPCVFAGFASTVEYNVNAQSPYFVSGKTTCSVLPHAQGYKYVATKNTRTISTGVKNGTTLTISNQSLYPVDEVNKTALMSYIKKWHANNNTLSATIVDGDDITLGGIVKIQRENGMMFKGIITKLERDNTSDYRTVKLEAHEWN